ncbi:sigma-70 family RNA polymerase sigma factor [Actinoplanes sp. DH11]|uniref:sigma-70 family RNA polymerase sigma factor n=1 Tax=Actinoplanes sp. DH11 TaxID=2857011 RepID=UPI001E461E19|nr:sigma-70 family RNA polymerase sigma factor [Actinoplanes sp. DH11]
MTFEEFLHAEMAGLARYAGALTGNHHQAEDVLSDALLIVSTRWWRIGRMAHPLAYVRRVVTSTFLSEQRTARRRRTEVSADPEVFDRQRHDPHGAVDDRDLVERLLARLPDRQRAAVVLRYLFDQSDDDIAVALDCSPATVRSHLSHARAALRLAPALTERG